MITSCRWSMLIWSQDVTCQSQQLFKGIRRTPQAALHSLYYLVFSYCLRIQYCTLGDCSFESVQLSSGGSDHTINAETSPTLLYWKRLKANIREKSKLKYLQLSFFCRVFIPHPFQRTKLQQICEQFFGWSPEITGYSLHVTTGIYTCILLNACKHFDIKGLPKLVSLFLSFG